jgi:NAD(P)-dependent dehydrogenase (short-subunit alcohol dehydrogenase family)
MPARSDVPVAVVANGSVGIGLEVCRQLARRRFAVVLGARDIRDAALAAKEIDSGGERVVPCQIEPDNSVNIAALGKQIRERFGRADVLVNNASTLPDQWAMASNTDLSPVAEALDVNLFGVWRLTQELLPLLRSSPRARVVNVTSEDGSIALMRGGRPAYSVSMAALNALTRLLAGELHRDGILVNAVSLGSAEPGAGSQVTVGRTAPNGVASIIWGVMLPGNGPTGTFTRDGRELPW